MTSPTITFKVNKTRQKATTHPPTVFTEVTSQHPHASLESLGYDPNAFRVFRLQPKCNVPCLIVVTHLHQTF